MEGLEWIQMALIPSSPPLLSTSTASPALLPHCTALDHTPLVLLCTSSLPFSAVSRDRRSFLLALLSSPPLQPFLSSAPPFPFRIPSAMSSGLTWQFRPSAAPALRSTHSPLSSPLGHWPFLSLSWCDIPSAVPCVVCWTDVEVWRCVCCVVRCCSVGEFLDVSALKLPATSSDLMERLSVNGGYYAFNYALLYALLLLFLSLQQPPLLFACVAIAAGGYYLFHMRRDAVVIGGTRLTEEQLRLLYLSISALLFLYAGGWPMLYVTALTALLSGLHAALRQRSLKSRGSTSLAGTEGEHQEGGE